MNKIEEAVEYMISVWDEVQGNWREHPDHVAQKFIEAEKEIQDQKVREHIDSVLPDEPTLTEKELIMFDNILYWETTPMEYIDLILDILERNNYKTKFEKEKEEE